MRVMEQVLRLWDDIEDWLLIALRLLTAAW